MNPHVKGLLSLFWRTFVFIPVGIIGLAALVVVLGLTVLPPIYAVIVFIDGRYVLGLLALVGWLLWIRFGAWLRGIVFEGSEHGCL
jgi:hypothetical protein